MNISEISDHYNRTIQYITDRDQFGKHDYWMSPEELESTGKGDCEDFAIAKFAKCLENGIDNARLAYVQHESLGAHMVCVVGDLVLDNLIPDIMPISERFDLISEVYSFDLQYIYASGETIGTSDTISLFQPIRTSLLEKQNDGTATS